jgi:Ulp1 family protease
LNNERFYLFANQCNQHWVLFVIDIQERKIDLYDSYHRGMTSNSQLQIEQIQYYFDTNVSFDNTVNISWNVVVHKCNYQKTTCDCGVYMLTFGLFLTDLKVDHCIGIDCEKLARLKIALDVTRGYIEDPRIYKVKYHDIEEYPSLQKNFDYIIDLSKDDDNDVDFLKHQLTCDKVYIDTLLDQINQREEEQLVLEKKCEEMQYIIDNLKNKLVL